MRWVTIARRGIARDFDVFGDGTMLAPALRGAFRGGRAIPH
jgi:hypothetical protein